MSKANAKNRVPEPEDKTSAVIPDVDYTYADGSTGKIQVHIPDNKYAYGSSEKTMQLVAEDVVGKHSGSNAKAVAAGESARAQVAQRTARQRAMANVIKNTRSVKFKELRDNTGKMIGVQVNVARQDEDGLWSIRTTNYYHQ